MITEDIVLIENVYFAIVEGLNKQNIWYEDFQYLYLIYDDLGFRQEQLVLHYSNKNSVTDKGISDDDSPELDYHLRRLFIQMSERGDNWKSMSLKFIGGKVTTNFSYEDNPPPW